eukprot:COSAG06_NODE_187_length_20790_cov_46.433232_8_plen_114_part_00
MSGRRSVRHLLSSPIRFQFLRGRWGVRVLLLLLLLLLRRCLRRRRLLLLLLLLVVVRRRRRRRRPPLCGTLFINQKLLVGHCLPFSLSLLLLLLLLFYVTVRQVGGVRQGVGV